MNIFFNAGLTGFGVSMGLIAGDKLRTPEKKLLTDNGKRVLGVTAYMSIGLMIIGVISKALSSK